MELWKKSGSRSIISNYRDITLSDCEAKLFLGFLRLSLRGAAQALAGSGQCGSGFGAGSTDTCHLLITQAMGLARVRKESCSILFVDVISAFASVLRRIILPGLPQTEEAWMIHLRNSGFTSGEAASVVSTAMSVASWTESGVSHHSLAIAQAAHETSWFTIDGLDRLSVFCKGVLAGTSVADIIFILAIAKVIAKVEDRLKEAELETYLPSMDAADHFGIDTYVN